MLGLLNPRDLLDTCAESVPRPGGWGVFSILVIASLASVVGWIPVQAEVPAAKPILAAQGNTPTSLYYIRRFRVSGGENLASRLEVETAVYSFMGPCRTDDDIENARAALEKVYHDKGYETVMVQRTGPVSPNGVVQLQVVPAKVGRLTVTGAKYFSPNEVKAEAPSLAEGTVPNFHDVARELTALNQLPDRHVTVAQPTPGVDPNTYDFNLKVDDSLPVHGSLEVNNRYSANTDPLRLNGSVSFANLWQMGHTLGASFQLAPQDPSQSEVISGYYLAHVPDVDGLSLLVSGTEQNSDVSTLGSVDVVGRGHTVGLRAILTLPTNWKNFYHSLSLGFDYKRYDQNINIAGASSITPITYYPFSAAYSATWLGKGDKSSDDYETDVDGTVNLHIRGLGDDDSQFNDNRIGANGSYIYFRGDVAHLRYLPDDVELYGKVQGQVADQPLLDNEQFSGGGDSSVRGYLESEVLGDNALIGSTELRSPSLGDLIGKTINDWRVYLFTEGGVLALDHATVGTPNMHTLASLGIGTRLKLADHFNGSLDLGVPLITGDQTKPFDLLLTFRVWAEF